jgi:hypothetical protein
MLKKYNDHWKSDTDISSPVAHWTEYNKNNKISYRNTMNIENPIYIYLY